MADAWDQVQPFEEGPIIFTPRLVMRPMTASEADLQNMQTLSSNAHVQKYIRPLAPYQSIEKTRELLPARTAPPAFNFAVHLRVESSEASPAAHAGPYVGAFGAPRGIPEVGYGLHQDYQGKGLAQEALQGYERMFWAFVPSAATGQPAAATTGFVDEGGAQQPAKLCRMAQEVLKGTAADHLYAITFKGNAGSCKLLEKAGYTIVEETDTQIEGMTAVEGVTATKDCRFVKPRPCVRLGDLPADIRGQA